MTDLGSSALAVVRREVTSTYNRLHSIHQDAAFVRRVVASRVLPVIPNLRCGAWYVDPALLTPDTTAAAYFKSTDGYTSQWAFNLHRANLHLLPTIMSRGGIVIVDSTRRGKRHPDALSRTVPIWCAVINRTLGLEGEHAGLFTPPDAVSPSEHAQMEAKIQGWANELSGSAYILPILTKPLRPFWISPDSSNPQVPEVDESTAFYPIMCVSASQRVQDGVDRRLGFMYVQGSGDDHELWSQGLTPDVFWAHKARLLDCPQDNLEDLIKQLMAHRETNDDFGPSPIAAVGGRLLVGAWTSGFVMPENRGNWPELDLSSHKSDGPPSATLEVPGYYPKQHPTRFLTLVLPVCLEYIRSRLSTSPDSRVCILCKDGKDLSIGIATAALALYFSDGGEFVGHTTNANQTKDSIRR